jgi:hypothetical protein
MKEPRLKKFKIVWTEIGDNGDTIEETYIRTASKIDSLFFRELEKRTGQCVYSIDLFVKETNGSGKSVICFDQESLTYIHKDEGVDCEISLFKTVN